VHTRTWTHKCASVFNSTFEFLRIFQRDRHFLESSTT